MSSLYQVETLDNWTIDNGHHRNTNMVQWTGLLLSSSVTSISVGYVPNVVRLATAIEEWPAAESAAVGDMYRWEAIAWRMAIYR